MNGQKQSTGDGAARYLTSNIEKCLSNKVFFVHLRDCRRDGVSGVVAVNLKDIGVELANK